jgi:hypothetical protein
MARFAGFSAGRDFPGGAVAIARPGLARLGCPKEDRAVIELTPQQQQALDAAAGRPLELVDPRTGAGYVLVRSDEFALFQSLREEEDFPDRRQVAILIQRAMAEDDGDDPYLDQYQDYRKEP